MRFCIYFLFILSLPVQGQVLRDPQQVDAAAQPPLVLKSSQLQPTPWRLDYVITSLQEEMRVVAESNMSAAERNAAVERILSANPLVLRDFDQQDNSPNSRTVEEAIAFFDMAMFEVVGELAPTEESRAIVEQAHGPATQLEPNRPVLVFRDPLQPITVEAQRITVATPTPTVVATEATVVAEEEAPEITVSFLKDSEVTTDMHDDDTVLADMVGEQSDLVLFNRINLWVGGAVQLDGYHHTDLLNLNDGGTDTELDIRRGEIIVRSSLFERGEIKIQYDLAEAIFRDFYWRWQFEERDYNVTVGQQKEPMGFDYLMGNKFGTAMERSSPSSEFSSFRSFGARLNRWIDFGEKRSVAGIPATRATAAVGIFTRDIGLDNENDTDGSITGRVTLGNAIDGERGLHIGVGGSWRQGDFESIAPRPELYGAERVLLAEPEADQLVTVALEAGASFGAIHGQMELFASNYTEGQVDGDGWGGYAQLGWFVTGEHREYRPRVGLWAPVNRLGSSAWEIFSRISYTKGDDELHEANDLMQISGGVNWYFRQFRTSANVIYGETDRPVSGFDDGVALIARVQYLF
jgi:phosphate-selective porin